MEEQQDDLQGWKQKYFDAIGNLESREKQWGEVEQILRQGINRLTLVADNSDHELNRQLESLRTSIRNSTPSTELQSLLSAISESILRLDEARKKQDAAITPAALMADTIGKISFPHGMGHRAKTLQKKLNNAEAEEVGVLAEEFALLLGDALKWATGEQEGSQESKSGKRGLFDKLFSSADKEGTTETTSSMSADSGLHTARNLLSQMISSLVKEPEQRNSFTEQLEASRQEAQLLRLGRELSELLRSMGDETVLAEEGLPVNEVLVRLLERLDIPAELGDEVEAVKGMLLQSLPAAEVDKVIAAIADLITEMRSKMQSEKAELETFLKQLTTRLQEIDNGFHTNVETQRESFRDGQALDDAVKVQVEGIEESVQQAEELTDLKTQIQQRVDTIRIHMREFRQAEGERLQKAEQQVAVLTEKLESVQGESNQLRQRLHDERNQAMIDPLTGIPNRLAYNERIKQEVARWRRYGTPLVIAVWDVDKFKSVNDTYGHQAGDKVLTVIGKVLHKQCRETDFVARFGGEEFVQLMPQTDLENAVAAVENLRKSVEETEFHFRGQRVQITISCGMSQFNEGDSAEAVFERADKALYQAKHSGRNRFCQG